MKTFNGSCHCGNITYVFGWPLADDPPLRKCACSFCTKHGAIYTGHPDASLSVSISDPNALIRYQFATKTASFFLCAKCGVVPFVMSVIEGRNYAVVNTNAFNEPLSNREVAVRNFEGESVEDRVLRRRKTWIRNVSMVGFAAP